MAIGEFYNASRVLIVAGKGGVGKTTVGATVAVAAARAGASVLCVELEGHSVLGRPFGVDTIDYTPTPLWRAPAPTTDGRRGSVRGRRLTPDEALVEHLQTHGLDLLAGRVMTGGAIDVVSSAAPGIRDLVTLGKIAQLERNAQADLLIVDAPAAGHALSFLQAPAGLLETGEGPIRDQAERVLEMFGDPDRCQVALVTLPEETPVRETIETAFSLEDLVDIKLAPVIVNGVVPEIPGLAAARAADDGARDADPRTIARRRAADHRLAVHRRERAAIEELARELPLPRIELPLLPTTRLGPDDLGRLADALTRPPTDRLDGGQGTER